jgi:tetratricopeptide (TPR) repeat protein
LCFASSNCWGKDAKIIAIMAKAAQPSFLKDSPALDLIAQGRVEEACVILTVASENFQSTAQWQALMQLLETIPLAERLGKPTLAALYASVLARNNMADAVLAFTKDALDKNPARPDPLLLLAQSYGLLVTGQSALAHEILTAIIPQLQGQELALAWLRHARSAWVLKKSWRESIATAKTLATTYPYLLGIIFGDEGVFLAQENLTHAALDAYNRALALLKNDPYQVVWLHYNIGITLLRVLDPEAERHFTNALKLTARPECAPLRAQVLNGLAAFRRSQGEWLRAEAGYREALLLTASRYPDQFDRLQAYLGLVRTLRLAGRASEALEQIELALAEPTLPRPALALSRAAVYLALAQPQASRADLDHLTQLGGPSSSHDHWMAQLLHAELARQADQPATALALLADWPTGHLQLREETRQFPALMQLLQAAGQPTPKPLPSPDHTSITVVATGPLLVAVNGRNLPLTPSSRAGELLVLLLEQGGAASADVVAAALYPALGHQAAARKAVNRLVQQLRAALGWPSSVHSLRGSYRLDPDSHWHYDIAQARSQGRFRGQFLAGIYSDWAVETDRQLQLLPNTAPDTKP